jgi:cell division protease FtsH
MDRALSILKQRRDVLERCARRLLEKETIEEKELAELVGPPGGPPLREAAE